MVLELVILIQILVPTIKREIYVVFCNQGCHIIIYLVMYWLLAHAGCNKLYLQAFFV